MNMMHSFCEFVWYPSNKNLLETSRAGFVILPCNSFVAQKEIVSPHNMFDKQIIWMLLKVVVESHTSIMYYTNNYIPIKCTFWIGFHNIQCGVELHRHNYRKYIVINKSPSMKLRIIPWNADEHKITNHFCSNC